MQDHPLPLLDAASQPRMWIGNRVTTPTHFNAFHNLAVVVCGRRRFTLFAPEQVGNLYIGPLDFAPTGAAISMARLDQPDDLGFPRLAQALECSLVSELEPGDAIYIYPYGKTQPAGPADALAGRADQAENPLLSVA